MTTSKQDVLNNIEEEWRALLDVLAVVPLDAYERPGAVVDWSLKDLLGHITTWDEVALNAVDVFTRGGKAPMYGEIDAMNAQAAARKKDIPLAIILTQLGEAHERLVSRLGTLSEQALQYPGLSHRMQVDTWEHYQEHRQDLERWLSDLDNL